MKEEKYFKFLGLVFIIITIFIGSINIIKKDRTYSEIENRYLVQFPRFSVERLFDGRFTQKYETYLNDQFYKRENWIYLNSYLNLLVNQRENQGVYYGSDGYLIEDFRPGSEEDIQRNLRAINYFTKTHPDIISYFLLVPNAISILNDKLPNFVPVINQENYVNEWKKGLSSQLIFINPLQTLQLHCDETLYYRTDHHWTTKGAYYTFLELAKVMNVEMNEKEYRTETLTSTFNGMLASSSGYLPQELDTIEIYLPITQNYQFVVHYVEEQKKATTLYEKSALDTRDKYAVFLGGNHALIDIQTTSSNQKRLLILKDSYANAFIPFLIPYYEEIIVVDPRYYYNDLNQLIEEKEVDEILYLYNINSFFKDNSLNLVLDNK